MAKQPAGPGKSTKRTGTRGRKKAAAAPTGLSAVEVVAPEIPAALRELADAIRNHDGGVVGAYRDPIGGHWHLLASLPTDQVAPTPFQRDLSETHVARLGNVIGRMSRFLDPIIVVPTPDGSYWTPNGHHRLAAMRQLGARSILAVVVPEIAVAYQILAMNTEKGHNLREKSLEVARMARSLVEMDPRPELDYALEFEEPAYLTLGLAYEQRGRLSGGAYHPVLRRVEEFLSAPLAEAIETRSARAARLLELDDKVAAAVASLKERGFASPYLKAFVVARLNPLRFCREVSMSADAAIEAMSEAAQKFDPAKVKIGDLASAPPGPADE